MEALTYEALGDSAGVGVGARDGRGYVDRVYDRLEAVAPRARLVNLCASGATSETVRARQLARAVAERPALATLFIGGNDLWRAVTARQVRRVADARGFALLDLFAVGLADLPHFFSPDGFHPSDEGYAHWAEQLWPLVRRAATR